MTTLKLHLPRAVLFFCVNLSSSGFGWFEWSLPWFTSFEGKSSSAVLWWCLGRASSSQPWLLSFLTGLFCCWLLLLLSRSPCLLFRSSKTLTRRGHQSQRRIRWLFPRAQCVSHLCTGSDRHYWNCRVWQTGNKETVYYCNVAVMDFIITSQCRGRDEIVVGSIGVAVCFLTTEWTFTEYYLHFPLSPAQSLINHLARQFLLLWASNQSLNGPKRKVHHVFLYIYSLKKDMAEFYDKTNKDKMQMKLTGKPCLFQVGNFHSAWWTKEKHRECSAELFKCPDRGKIEHFFTFSTLVSSIVYQVSSWLDRTVDV